MAVDPAHLAAHKDAMLGKETSGANGKPKTENVVKMFMDKDKIDAIKALDSRVVIGSPPMTVSIKPLSPRGMVQAYPLIRTLLLPIVGIIRAQARGEKVTIQDAFEAFGEHIDMLPKLIYIILQRGNSDITEDWVMDHFDLALDLQTILPPFFEQNALAKLFSGNAKPVPQTVASEAPDQPHSTEESPQPSPSSVDGTDGKLDTSGTT